MSGFTSDPPTDSALATIRQNGTRIYAVSGEYEDPLFRSQIQHIHELCMKSRIPFELRFIPGMIHEVPLDLSSQFQDAWNWLHAPLTNDDASAQQTPSK
jgi:hypothetical protein